MILGLKNVPVTSVSIICDISWCQIIQRSVSEYCFIVFNSIWHWCPSKFLESLEMEY